MLHVYALPWSGSTLRLDESDEPLTRMPLFLPAFRLFCVPQVCCVTIRPRVLCLSLSVRVLHPPSQATSLFVSCFGYRVHSSEILVGLALFTIARNLHIVLLPSHCFFSSCSMSLGLLLHSTFDIKHGNWRKIATNPNAMAVTYLQSKLHKLASSLRAQLNIRRDSTSIRGHQ